MLKAALYFNDAEYFDIFWQAYDAATKYFKRGEFFVEVEMYTAIDTWPYFNSLQAFWPGMQGKQDSCSSVIFLAVLIGDLDNSIQTAWAFHLIWNMNGFTPEKLNLLNSKGFCQEMLLILPVVAGQAGWPLRPELAESTWYLACAFPDDPAYFYLAKQMVDSIEKYCRVQCGYAAILSVENKSLEDRMDSFFLAETLKYLYLLY